MSPAPNKTWSNRNQFRPEDELRSGAVIVNPAFRDLIGGDDVEVASTIPAPNGRKGPPTCPVARDQTDS